MVPRIMFILLINSFLCTADKYNDDNLQTITLYDYLEGKEYEIFLNNRLLIILANFKYCYPNMYLHHCYPFNLENRQYYNETDLIVEIPRVTFDINGSWQCFIGTDFSRHFYFKILVKDPNPLQMVVVNHLVLAPQKCNEFYMAEYHYYEGDEMDVYCMSRNNTCTVQMSYTDTQNDKASSKYLRVNFQSRNAPDIICTRFCHNSETKVVIRFILNTAKDIKMNINGIKVGEIDLSQKYVYRNMDCAYFMNENDLFVSFAIPNQEIRFNMWNVDSTVTSNNSNNELLLNVNPRALKKLDVKIKLEQYNPYYNEYVYYYITLDIRFIPLNIREYIPVISSPSTSASSVTKVAHNHGKQGIIITMITIITVICLICISTYVYKKIYKRSRPASTNTVRFMKGPGENGNLQYNSNRKKPIHPSEQEHNGTVLIVDQINDIYDNVDRNVYTKSQKDESENIYANNNYERDQGNNSDEETQPGLIYADLNLSECLYANQIRSKRIPSGFNVNSNKDTYAQIHSTNVRHK